LPADLKEFARTLRVNQTDAEKLLWVALRSRRFSEAKFRRQHPVGPYVLDFHCHDFKLAIEADGGQHNTLEVTIKDEARTRFLQNEGIRVLRFWNHEVLQDTEAVFEAIYMELARCGTRNADSLTPTLSRRERGNAQALTWREREEGREKL
jgi:very-short-patch-repair endonuclease